MFDVIRYLAYINIVPVCARSFHTCILSQSLVRSTRLHIYAGGVPRGFLQHGVVAALS